MEFKCDQCDATYPGRMSLTNHKRLKHGDVTQFNCTYCPYSTTKKDHLELHVRSIHGKIKVTCDICSKEFANKSHLNRHKRSKHVETLQTKRKATETHETPLKRFRITQPELEDAFEEIDIHQLLNLTDSDVENILEFNPVDSRAEKQLEPEKEKLSCKGNENEPNVYNCKQYESTHKCKKKSV